MTPQRKYTIPNHQLNHDFCRSTFTPIFTSGKMKGMVGFIDTVAKNLQDSFEREAQSEQPFDLKEKFGKFSMDTIASCAFGMDAQSFTDEESRFVFNAKSIFRLVHTFSPSIGSKGKICFFRRSFSDFIKFIGYLLPGGSHLMQAMEIPLSKKAETEFFCNLIETTLNHRQQSGTRRNDLIDLMLDAMKNPTEVSQEEDSTEQIHRDSKI